MNQPDIVKHWLSTTPRFIPVETNSPDKLRSLRIPEHRAGTLVNQIAIVVPRDDFLVGKTFTVHRGPKVLLEKIALLFVGVNTRFPCLRSHRFVLNRHTPDRYSIRFICFYELW